MFTSETWIQELQRENLKMISVSTALSEACGLLENHQVMRLLSLMIVEMHLMLSVHWMGRMAGVWSSLTTLKVEVEAVVEAVGVDAGVIVMVKVVGTSVMNVGKLVILLENVACA